MGLAPEDRVTAPGVADSRSGAAGTGQSSQGSVPRDVDLKVDEEEEVDEEVEEEVEDEGDVAGRGGSSNGSNGGDRCSLGVTATLHAVMPPPHLQLGKDRGEASGQVPAAFDSASDRCAARLPASDSAKAQV